MFSNEFDAVPDRFKCPITLTVMKDPVLITKSGRSFERAALDEIIARQSSKSGRLKFLCPVTNVAFHPVKEVIPNRELKEIIEDWKKLRNNKLVPSRTSNNITSSSNGSSGSVVGSKRPREEIAKSEAATEVDCHMCALVEKLRTGTSTEKLEATISFEALAQVTESRSKLVTAKAIPLLIAALALTDNSSSSDTDNVKMHSATALRLLAMHAECRVLIVAEGAIPLLVAMLQTGSAVSKDEAAGAISWLCSDAVQARAVVAAGALIPLVKAVRDGVRPTVFWPIAALRMLGKNAIEIVEAGVVPAVVSVLTCGSVQSKGGAAALVAVLTAQYSVSRRSFMEAGAIPALARILRDEVSAKAVLNSVMAISNIVGHKSVDTVRVVKDEGLIDLLVKTMEQSDATADLKLAVTKALYSLAASKAEIRALVGAVAVSPLVSLLQDECVDGKRTAVKALAELAFGSAETCKSIASAAGAIPALVGMLRGVCSAEVSRCLFQLTSHEDCVEKIRLHGLALIETASNTGAADVRFRCKEMLERINR